MRTLLLSASLLAVAAAGAQTTYNFFDPADCDAEGWLWFDSQAKIDKYVGFDANCKIRLLSTTYEDADGQYAEPYGDPTRKGYNAEGVEGGEGSWTGAIILNESSTGLGSDAPNGGGIMFQLPDCASIDVALSQEEQPMCVGLRGAKGWVEDIDCATIQTYLKIGILANRPLATTTQFTWKNVQDVANGNTGLKLASPEGEKVTGVIRNNRGCDLLLQGIRIMTYTNTNESGVAGVEADAFNVAFDGNTIAAAGAAIDVYSLTGAKVAAGVGSVDASALAGGVYVVKANCGGNSVVKKIVK